MKAIRRHIRISPKKLNLVAGMVRRKNATEALGILKFTPKKAAGILYKVLHSAVSNAENNFKQSRDNLVIKEIVVSPGATLKRHVPVSRGRAHPVLKRTSHVTLTVGVDETEKKTDTKADTKDTKDTKQTKEAKQSEVKTVEKKEKEPEVKIKTSDKQ